MSVSLKTMKLLQDAGVTGDSLRAILASIVEDFSETPHVSLTRDPASPPMSRRRRARKPSGPSWEAKRKAVFARDRYICQYCNEDSAIVMTIDHVTPLSRGGTNDTDNLKTACFACNNDKADLTLEEWERKKALGCAPIPDRKPYTLRDLRRPKLAHDAPTVAEAERRKLSITRHSQYPKPTDAQRAEASAIAREVAARDKIIVSKARVADRQIVESAQRALAAAGIE